MFRYLKLCVNIINILSIIILRMNEQVLTNDIINNSSDINIKEIALDGMELLSNKKKTILKQDNTMKKNLEVSDNESVDEIDDSDLESFKWFIYK